MLFVRAQFPKTDLFYKGFQNPTSLCLKEARCDPSPQIRTRMPIDILIYDMYNIYIYNHIYTYIYVYMYYIYNIQIYIYICVCVYPQHHYIPHNTGISPLDLGQGS